MKGSKEGGFEDFLKKREALNELVLEKGGLEIKRFFNLDARVHEEGALPVKTKDLIGLVASLVLRCDDCVSWHLSRCAENEVTDEELSEALSIGLVIGGSITIPHVRNTFAAWEDLKDGSAG